MSDCVALQHDIDTLLAWSNTWKMHFNPSKCQVMSVTRQRKRLPFVYRLGEVVLPCVTSFTYLGVVISSDLRWNLHTDMVTAKATRTLNLIRRNLYRCPQNIKSLAYRGTQRWSDPCLNMPRLHGIHVLVATSGILLAPTLWFKKTGPLRYVVITSPKHIVHRKFLTERYFIQLPTDWD